MKAQIRRAIQKDIPACGRIAYLAFKSIADQHNFPPDFPSVEDADNVIAAMVSNPGIHGIVAEADGRVLGSNFMDERATVAGIGPISVDPEVQNGSVGRQMMEYMLAKVTADRRPGVRLVQTAYHNRSLSLYAKLGFDIREPLSVMQGPAIVESIAGYRVRRANRDDVGSCNRLCFDVHGLDRGGELLASIGYGSATVVEHLGRITGYATMLGIGGHAVGESNTELKALISAARSFGGPGFLLPSRNGELLRWCFSKGLRLMQQMTLMSVGLYNEPQAPFLPSILF